MRVFVTGATGFVGSAVVRELIGAGHQVLGLARSDASAAALEAAGGAVHRGSVDDPDSLRRGAEEADGVIHTAFNHDFTRFAESCGVDRHAIGALADALAGSDRPLIVTSGIGLLSKAGLITEDDTPDFAAPASPRVATEAAASAAADRRVNVSVMRLPPSVHGDGDHGFVPILIGIAREKGVAAYVGDGANRWPAVHRLDAAVAYRKAIEASHPARRYHAVAEEGVPFRDIAEAIGRGLGVPAASKSADEAKGHFGWFAHFAAIDCASSSAATRDALGWSPTHRGLIEDLETGTYFAG
jgi:nucleoside-diphosphate-sugar epimerase